MKLVATISPCSDGTLKACFPDSDYQFARNEFSHVVGEVTTASHIDHLISTGNFAEYPGADAWNAGLDQQEQADDDSIAAEVETQEDDPVPPPPAQQPVSEGDFGGMTDEDLRNEIELRSGTRPAATDDRANLIAKLSELRGA